jgi:glucose-6-phosphate isomerase
MAGTGATASQAWAILKRHARDEISPLRLQELCRDNDRVSSLVSVYNATPDRMLLVDLSRQRMTLETLNHLLRLATVRDVKKFITRLAWGGQNDPDNPIIPARLRKTQALHTNNKTTRFVEEGEQEEEQQGKRHRRRNNVVSPERSSPANNIISIPSFHLSLRAPAGKGLEMLTAPDGNNVLPEIHRDWERIQRISDLMRRGQLPVLAPSILQEDQVNYVVICKANDL